MSLGYPRQVAAGAVAVVAAAVVVLAGAPALAGQIRHQEWWLQALHVPTAWQTSRGGAVTVALLDTGVDPAQADLTGSVTTGPDYTHSGRKAGSPLWGAHGTAMASLIAGHGHGAGGASGVIGVAPAAHILSVRVTLEASDPLLRDQNVASGLPDAIAQGIRYAVKHGASVIDLPLDPETGAHSPGSGGSPAERAAIGYALRHHVVLVAPAGDNGAHGDAANYPAAYPGVIAVGAFDSTFTKPSFSSHRPYVTITAPGVGMLAARTPTGYTHVSSTSAASAVVAGIAALIRAQLPGLTPAQVTKALSQSTVYRPASGRVPGSGYGTVDAALALLTAAKLGKAASAPPTPSASPTPAATVPASAPATAAAPRRSPGSSLPVILVAGAALALILLVAVAVTVVQIRRRRARAARPAPIRLSAQLQPRREALPPGELQAQVAADRLAVSTATASSAQGSGARPPGVGDPWAGSPWPPAALPGRAVDADGAAGDRDGASAGTEPAGSASPAGGASPMGGTTAGGRAAGAGNAAGGGNAAGDPAAGPGAARALPARQPAGSRAPKISGTPPWGPAPKPETELPWTAPPARRPAAPAAGASSAGPLPKRKARPAPSPWDVLAEEVWPGGPAAGRPQPSRPDDGPGGAEAAGAGGTGTAATAGAFGGESDDGENAAGEAEASARASEIRSRWSGFLPRRASLPADGDPGIWAGAASRDGADEGPAAPASAQSGNRDRAVTGGMLSAGLAGPPWDDDLPGADRGSPAAGGPADSRRPQAWSPADATEALPAITPDDE